jgi:hypothetical protein
MQATGEGLQKYNKVKNLIMLCMGEFPHPKGVL